MFATPNRTEVLRAQAVSRGLARGAHAGGGSGAQLHGAGRVQHRCGIPLGLPRPKGNYQATLHITVITILLSLYSATRKNMTCPIQNK